MSELHERQVELANMDRAILEGKNVLVSLAEEKEAYLVAREEEAEERVLEALKASESAVNTASDNMKKVEKMRQELEGVVYELSEYSKQLKTKREAFSAHVEEVSTRLEGRVKDLSAFEKKCNDSQTKVDAEWASINRSKVSLDEQESHVKDQRARLSAAMKEYDRRD